MVQPNEIFWQVSYKCPACNWLSFLSQEQVPHTNNIVCYCGYIYDIAKPKLSFGEVEVKSKTKMKSEFIKEATQILKSQGYSIQEIEQILRIALSQNIDSIEGIFEDVLTKL